MSTAWHAQARLKSLRPVGRCAVLVASVLTALLVAIPIAYRLSGLAGAKAVAVAALVCGCCSCVALLLTLRCRGPNAALQGLLFSMFFQMGLPLIAGMLLTQSRGVLSTGGVFGWIVVFHVLTLAVKTVLVLPVIQAAGRPGTAEGV